MVFDGCASSLMANHTLYLETPAMYNIDDYLTGINASHPVPVGVRHGTWVYFEKSHAFFVFPLEGDK
jgi:hypothetical protein